MAIEMGKKYTYQGNRGTVKFIDGKYDHHPVIWERERDGMPFLFTLQGKSLDSDHCLVEISPYSDIAIDAPGWARDADKRSPDHKWTPVHFARVGKNGKPICFSYGKTSHTTQETFEWDEFTTTKPEEVA